MLEDRLVSSVALYADGGVVARNPSVLGGTWAWCGVDERGWRWQEHGGFVLARDIAPPLPPVVTNNQMEWLACSRRSRLRAKAGTACCTPTASPPSAVAVPAGDAGMQYPSEVLVPRGLPLEWFVQMRGIIAYQRVELHHLKGHPTAVDLRRWPHSSHQVWATWKPRRQATKSALLLASA